MKAAALFIASGLTLQATAGLLMVEWMVMRLPDAGTELPEGLRMAADAAFVLWLNLMSGSLAQATTIRRRERDDPADRQPRGGIPSGSGSPDRPPAAHGGDSMERAYRRDG